MKLLAYIHSEQTWQALLTAIVIKRRELINTGMTYGFTDDRTIRCSRQLDNLLNLKKDSDYHELELMG